MKSPASAKRVNPSIDARVFVKLQKRADKLHVKVEDYIASHLESLFLPRRVEPISRLG